jgi:membrane associated rhomboid family serine protease
VGLGWALILAAGIAGNVVTALTAGGPHLAVGASTSAFGALGVLSMFQAMENHRRYGDWKSVWSRVWIPLGGGLAMFGLLGVNPGSDVAAHAWGFVCGLVLAVPFVVPRPRIASETVDAFLKVGTVLVIMLAWRAVFRFAS